jgi:hypothetical protein
MGIYVFLALALHTTVSILFTTRRIDGCILIVQAERVTNHVQSGAFNLTEMRGSAQQTPYSCICKFSDVLIHLRRLVSGGSKQNSK